MTVEELMSIAAARTPAGQYAIGTDELLEMVFAEPHLREWLRRRCAELLIEGENDGAKNRDDN